MVWWHVLNTLAALVILTAICRYQKTKAFYLGGIVFGCTFFMSLLYFEWVYAAMSGIVDPQDDTLYLAWVQRALNGNMLNCASRVYIAFTNRDVVCGGTPGAALFMLPFIVLKRLILKHSLAGQLQVVDVQLARINIACFGLLTMYVLFTTFRKITTSTISVFLATFILIGTSLVKWLFVRPIFTHGPEMFVASVLIYLLTKLYMDDKKRELTIFMIGMTLGVECLVRGEYWFLTPIFAAMVFVSRPLKQFIFSQKSFNEMIFFGVGILPFLFVYKLVISRVGDYAKGKGATIFTKFADFTDPIILNKFLTSQSELLTSLWTSGSIVFTSLILAVICIFRKSKFSGLYICAVIFTLVSFILTSVFPVPLGSEWQHRYLLKIYPVCLMVLALIYRNSGLWTRRFIWLNLLYSFAKQYNDAVNWNEDTYDGAFHYFETMRKFMTDSHLAYHGFDSDFYRSYTAFVILLSGVLFIYIIKSCLKNKLLPPVKR